MHLHLPLPFQWYIVYGGCCFRFGTGCILFSIASSQFFRPFAYDNRLYFVYCTFKQQMDIFAFLFRILWFLNSVLYYFPIWCTGYLVLRCLNKAKRCWRGWKLFETLCNYVRKHETHTRIHWVSVLYHIWITQRKLIGNLIPIFLEIFWKLGPSPP